MVVFNSLYFMEWYQWLAIASLLICVGSLLFHLIRLIKLGSPKDLSSPKGNPRSAMAYAFMGSMSPAKKESAFLHLPTYTAGIFYHLGTFLSIFIFLMLLLNFKFEGWITWAFSACLIISGISGLGILVKRIVKPQMRTLSNVDDYISNLLVTIFHFITVSAILNSAMLPVYFVLASLLLLYIPVGKLKHTLYFFAARYQLGFFYGWRGVWPPK
jgi:hypothetical protein